uniref:ANK_REP_REGION domain-containing protein n=1 Tax=Trichobilharzia regenti TaxID=157069 RepID=A0AA85IV81_TRIRE|nr:unnamed protein product [Trichobilharzia regenti]
MIQFKLNDSDICERRKAQLKEWCGSETDHASTKMREPEKIKFPLSVQLLAACSNSDLDEFSRLLKLGTDINTQNADGLTSTHLACINVDFDFLKFLISNGANINLQDHEGWTPLHAAASVGCCELARFLIENGADLSVLSVDLELPIDVAQDDEMIKLLTDAMKKQGIDADAVKQSEEQMLLHDAQYWLNSENYKPVVDPRTGATPLHVAACKDYTKAMEILLKIPGIDINAKDFDGWTALHAAAHWNRETSARMLANAGASFDEQTRASQSVFDVADKDMIVLLRQLRERQRAERQSNASKVPDLTSKPVEAIKRSHPSDLEEAQDSESSDDNSLVEIDQLSTTVSKKPTTEKDFSSASGDIKLLVTSVTTETTTTTASAATAVTKSPDTPPMNGGGVIFPNQESINHIHSPTNNHNDNYNNPLLIDSTTNGLRFMTPPPKHENVIPVSIDNDHFHQNSNNTTHDDSRTTLKSIITPSEEPPIVITNLKTDRSLKSTRKYATDQDPTDNFINGGSSTDKIINNNDDKSSTLLTNQSSRLPSRTSTNKPPVGTPPRRLSPPFIPPTISSSSTSSPASSSTSSSSNLSSTDASKPSDKISNIISQEDNSNNNNNNTSNITESKYKTGIVSIIPAPRRRRSIDEDAEKESSLSKTGVKTDTLSSTSSITSSTTTSLTTTTASTTTPPRTGRTITKIIAVKPRRSDPQKANTTTTTTSNSGNTEEKDVSVSSNNSHLDTDSNSSASEYTTNRRISVVMAPTKSGETETQRSVKARYVRSTRRSTQGVTSDDVEQAKKLVDKNNSAAVVGIPSQPNDDVTKSVNTSSSSSPMKNRSTLDSANGLRRFTENDLVMSSRSTNDNIPTTTTSSVGGESGGRLSSRNDYSTNIGRENNHISSTGTGRHVNFSGDLDVVSSTGNEENSLGRRQTFSSRVRSSEHSPTSDYQGSSGGYRERRNIRERGGGGATAPERILSSKSFSNASDIERRISDSGGRSEYTSSSSAYSASNRPTSAVASVTNTNSAIQNDIDVKGIIQRPTSRFLYHQMQSSTNPSGVGGGHSSSPTYSWNPSSQNPTCMNNNNNNNSSSTTSTASARSTGLNNNNNNHNDYYSSSTTNSMYNTPRDSSQLWQDSKDYKRLYEKEKEERDKLQRELDRCQRQINQLRNELHHSHSQSSASLLRNSSNDYGYTNSETNNYSNNNNNNNSQAPETSSRIPRSRIPRYSRINTGDRLSIRNLYISLPPDFRCVFFRFY